MSYEVNVPSAQKMYQISESENLARAVECIFAAAKEGKFFTAYKGAIPLGNKVKLQEMGFKVIPYGGKTVIEW